MSLSAPLNRGLTLMNSSASGSNNPSTFSGAETPPAAAQAFVPAGGAQTFTPASDTGTAQPAVSNTGAQTFAPPADTPAPAFSATPATDVAPIAGVDNQLESAADKLTQAAAALTEAANTVSGDAGGVAQPEPAVEPDNQFTPPPAPEAAAEPMSPNIPEDWRQDAQGRWRDSRGRFVPTDMMRQAGLEPPAGGGGGGGGGMGLRQRLALARRHPLGRAMFKVGRFAFTQAGSTSINQALQGLPAGGIIAGALSKLEEIGMRGAEFELAALQSGMTRGLGQGTGYATQNASYHSIRSLSSTLGIPPSAAASMLRDVGTGTQGELTVADIAGLTVRGFDASAVSAIGGQLQAAGAGGAGTVLQTMGIARARGLSNIGVMSFAQATAGFATARRQAGLDITDASMTARRARSMILRGEERPSLEANIATLGRFQSVAVNASKGLSGFMSGMAEQMLQAYAFEQAGGDVFRATAMLEDMSADPVAMREAMLASGATDEDVDHALLGTGQLTTTDIRRGRQARRGAPAGRMRTGIASTKRALAASRAVAQKGQRDLEQLYGAEGGGESVVSRFNTLLKAQSRYQTEVLKKMPNSAQINKIVDRLVAILDATDFIKEIAIKVYGGGTPASTTRGTGVTNVQLGNSPNTRVRVRGGTRF